MGGTDYMTGQKRIQFYRCAADKGKFDQMLKESRNE